MLPSDALKNLLSQSELTRTDKLLLCLAVEGDEARQVKEIRQLATSAGLREARKWNVSSVLSRAGELAVRTDGGWELTAAGQRRVAKIAGPLAGSPVPRVASALRVHLAKIANPDTQAFVEEAVACLESRQYRAAVVLSWVGAVAVLYDYVVVNDLAGFNKEATTRFVNSKYPWVPAKNADDLARMKESEFLVILQKRSVLGKSVRLQLKNCLDLRNGCGHPNSLQIAEHAATAHIEMLILNVFSKFA